MKKILVIDDHDEFRRMMNRMLDQEGYEVIQAPDGKVGINLYHEHDIDLVITDIFMPEKEGIETIIELKNINPEVKIIVVSGGGSRRDLNYFSIMEDLGVENTFEKPFDNVELLKAVKELIAEEAA